jgi:hypothetical protein
MISTCLDKIAYAAKPTDIARLSSEISKQSTIVNFKEFCTSISSGQSFTVATAFKDDHRTKANAIGQQIFAADIDTGNLSLSDLQALSKTYFIQPAIVYESFSSAEGNRKWRVLFLSSEAITDKAKSLALMKSIQQHFNSDRAIVDHSRLLYGTNKAVSYANENYFDHKSVKIEVTAVKEKTYKGIAARNNFTPKTDKAIKYCRVKLTAQSINLPRYYRIFYSALELADTGNLTQDFIVNFISNTCASSKLYADYDKNPADIAEACFAWLAKKNK